MTRHSPARRDVLRLATAGSVSVLLAGCASPVRGPAVPVASVIGASVVGVPNERFFPSAPGGLEALEREALQAGERYARSVGVTTRQELPSLNLLSVSGGGENGAFGAGLLCGWSDQGTRPPFFLVTGISTGALIAPFAFLGSTYDPVLRKVYTETSARDILEARGYLAMLYDDALADTAPLFATISRYMDEALLAEIARGYDQGRLLLIGTSNLDAQLPVIWNIGAIAKSGHPKALDTVRRIMLASASIPAAFPPVLFDVTVDGQPYQELHVDGGAFVQAFLYPPAVTRTRRELQAQGRPVAAVRAYLIRNGRLDPEWASVDRRVFTIAGRAISTMIWMSGANDVVRLYNTTERDGVDYNLAFMGSDFNIPLTAPFEQGYMRALFDYGYQRARRGYDWAKKPPFGY